MSPLSVAEIERTAGWIASVQLANGMVPWYQGGHTESWNDVEATMALAAGGRWSEVGRAFIGWRPSSCPTGAGALSTCLTGSSSRGGTPTCAPTLPAVRGGAHNCLVLPRC